MKRPPESLKAKASLLAHLIAAKENGPAGELLEELNCRGRGDAHQPLAPDSGEESGRIGIYKPRTINNEKYFERDGVRYGEWKRYANVHRIPVRGQNRRVLFFGESVARGYFYDPHYTPASVLENLLNAGRREDKIEVVDLAITSTRMFNLKEVIPAAMELRPNAIVIFGGNNWKIDLFKQFTSRDKDALRAAMEEARGFACVKGLVEEICRNMVSDFLEEVGRLGAKHQIPVLFIIPEYNLLDCHSTPQEKVITALPGGVTAQWLEARRLAEKALAEDDLTQAEAAAQIMIARDESHPWGYELLARCLLKQERFSEARHCLEVAKDTDLFDRATGQPRIYQVIQETIRQRAGRYGVDVVDLPQVFEQYQAGKLPGRELFLDYCHLTADGIQVAMKSAAAHLLRALEDEELPADAPVLAPDARVAGMAHFFAALHNAHWGQPYEILYHHCGQALKASDSTASLMRTYMGMATRSASNNLCKDFEHLVSTNLFEKYFEGLMHPRGEKPLDLDLADAMVASLQAVGVSCSEEVNALRKSEHGVTHRPISLLDPFYHKTTYADFDGKKVAYFRARDITSAFFLVASRGVPVLLRMTYRTLWGESDKDQVSLWVNQTLLQHLPASSAWKTCSVWVPAELVTEGVNKITFKWPYSGEAATPGNRPHADLINDPFVVFGELHELVASTRAGDAATAPAGQPG